MNFVVWAVTGVLIGWLVAKGEPARTPERPADSRWMMSVGLLGAIGGGLLSLPILQVDASPSRFVAAFNFISVNAYAATFGSTFALWGRELLSPAR